MKKFKFKKDYDFKNAECICTLAQKYYQLIIEYVQTNFKDEIASIIVFGSSLGIEFTRYSDLDFIVIVNNHHIDSSLRKALIKLVFERDTNILTLTQQEYEDLKFSSPLFYQALSERSEIIYEK